MSELDLKFPEKLQCLFTPARYKVLYGGRGSGKSWGIARALIVISTQRTIRVLCAREIQKSLEESVHKLLKDQIYAMGLQGDFEILQTKIKNKVTGSEFSFEGIKYNVDKIKSYEGVDICWVEEAHQTSKGSWDVLLPTIRKPGSEIWISFNPELETDETYKRFVKERYPGSVVEKVNWRDNPWFPAVLMAEMEECKKRSFDDYMWIWEGECRLLLDGAVFAEELRDAKTQGRLSRVPYDPLLGVHVFVDLGWADSTALWFTQRGRFDIRYIKYFADRQKKWEYFLTYIQNQGYVIDTIWLPHDARAKHIATGTSVWEITGAKGFRRRLVPRLKLFDGINAARTIFPMAYFDQENCAEGIRALQHYRYAVNEDTQSYSKEPLHDWASHGADGFRYSAIGMQAPKSQSTLALSNGDDAINVSALPQENWGNPPPMFGSTGWMK